MTDAPPPNPPTPPPRKAYRAGFEPPRLDLSRLRRRAMLPEPEETASGQPPRPYTVIMPDEGEPIERERPLLQRILLGLLALLIVAALLANAFEGFFQPPPPPTPTMLPRNDPMV